MDRRSFVKSAGGVSMLASYNQSETSSHVKAQPEPPPGGEQDTSDILVQTLIDWHEESAAFMAGGFAKHSGRLGACVATTGPGAIHLLNGLYDSAFDGAPVIAITGTTFHDLEGMRFYQSVNTLKLYDRLTQINFLAATTRSPANADE